jgi:PAS domain S-box-containing protein
MDIRGLGAPPTAPSESSTAQLSAGDRDALARARGTRLPLVLVLIALTFAVLLPQLSQRRVTALRNEINAFADPARQELTAIQLYLTRGGQQRRGYNLTHEERYRALAEATQQRRLVAERDLIRYAHMLDGPHQPKLTVLATRLQQLDRELDSVVVFEQHPTLTAGWISSVRARGARIQAIADTLGSAIDRATVVRQNRVGEIETMSMVLTGVLVLFGLGTAFVVAQLGTRYRNLAIRLNEHQARFLQIAENLTDVVWLSEPNLQRHLYVNSAFERIWGRTRESLEANPESFMDSVHVDDRERVRQALVAIPKEKTETEFRIVQPDGQVRWVWSRAFPVRDSTGQVFRVAGILEDITDERLHVAERERLLDAEHAAREVAERGQEDLKRVTESRVRLIRGFTHDVKNPLGVADAYLALMEEGGQGGLPPKQQETLKVVRRSISHALELIRKLLDLARAEAGQLEVHQEATDVVAIVRDVTESYRPQAQTKKLALAIELPDKAPPLRTDAARVRQVVGNLVSNALKYTPDGGHVHVTVRVEPGPNDVPDHADIIVADDGPGIAPDKVSLLFIEFTRFDAGTEGSGIGLAISQKIAHALGGEISVENHPNEGCVFTFRLPIANRPDETPKAAA